MLNSTNAASNEQNAPWLGRVHASKARHARSEFSRIERRQWWLSSSGAVVTLLLSIAIASFALPVFLPQIDPFFRTNLEVTTRALIAMTLLFDVYVVYQQLEIYRMRKQLVAREELFRLISENAADMIAVVDVNGNRLYNSPAYEKFLGYTAEELRQTSPYDQIHPEDQPKVLEAAREATETGLGRRVEYRIRHKNGQWRILESTASAVRNTRGEVEKLVIVNREITDRKQLEQQLFLSQKLEAVGRLSGGIAHDFNNLLGVIIGYSQVLQQLVGKNDELREPVDEILKAGERAASLTKQLLAFSRKQALEPTVLDLNAVVSEVDKMLRRLIGENIELKINLDPQLGSVKADRSQIEQVILNLAVNSRDAMPDGGKLTIETSNAVLGQADCERYQYVIPGKYILLSVRDNGCGMDEETQSHMFEPFFTTKESGKGTGLGLATVYGVIKQSGGFIWVESSPGNGALFKIYLPQVEEAPEIQHKVESSPSLSLATQTILLVEDEQSLRKLTHKILADVGYEVLEAKDASQALEVAGEMQSEIHLLLTDIIMPGLSGRALAQRLCPVRPQMKVLYMSGYTDGEIAPKGVLDPSMVILRKPFKSEELMRTVRQVLASAEK
ncbi:MAG TPA: PAS domain S-box protein [Candidatus Acidoferrales bacterium]|nr:PAS domain S-box protein [Candidatus Acidoferrales bacterium]